jgi:hypothetical protein
MKRGYERKKIKMGTLCNTRFGESKVTGIQLCELGEKYGIGVDEIFVDLKDRCVFDFANGHWQYGDQVWPCVNNW